MNATTIKFTSQELDEESGLYYYRSRFYDPSLGRFLNPDSIIPDWYNSQAYNRYAYVYNNPIIYTDPTGHVACGGICVALAFIAKVAWDIMTSPDTTHAPMHQNDTQQTTPQAPDFTNLKKIQKGKGISPDGSGITAGTPPKKGIDSQGKPGEKALSDTPDFSMELEVSPNAARRHLRRSLGKGEGQAHHIVPWEARNHPVVRKAAKGGFNINGPENGIRLGSNQHLGSHPKYNNAIQSKLDRALQNNLDITPQEAARFC